MDPHGTSLTDADRATRIHSTRVVSVSPIEPYPLLELSSDSSSEAPSDEDPDYDDEATSLSQRIQKLTLSQRYLLLEKKRFPPRTMNHISLHIYDLIASDTQMYLPWGCVCEIGKCFNNVNNTLHSFGTGAYHVGVEVNGIEYAFGATSIPGRSGIFSCIPKLSPGYQYRTSIHFGNVPLQRQRWVRSEHNFHQVEEFVEGRTVIMSMCPEYLGTSYDILRKNCCTFAYDACVRLGVEEDKIPSWFRNLAETGAYSQDVANTVMMPLHRVLSNEVVYCGDDTNSVLDDTDTREEEDATPGFETMIARRNNVRDVVIVASIPNNSPAASSTSDYRRSTTAAF